VKSAQRTVVALRNSTIQFCDAVGDVAPAGLGLADFERYPTVRGAKLSPGTRRREFSDVRGFLRWLVDTGALARDPSAGVKAPRVPRAVHRALPGDDAKRCSRCAPTVGSGSS
jgi:site-specific recombinase XerD